LVTEDNDDLATRWHCGGLLIAVSCSGSWFAASLNDSSNSFAATSQPQRSQCP
jgi:hypothetical protein